MEEGWVKIKMNGRNYLKNRYKVIFVSSLVLLLLGCSSIKSEVLNGTKVINLSLNDKGVFSFPTWSPSGKEIAFNLEGNMWILNLDDFTKKKITNYLEGNGRSVEWKSQDELLLLSTDENGKFGENYQLNLVNRSKNQAIVLLNNLSTVRGFSINQKNHNEIVIGITEYGEVSNTYNIILYNLLTKTSNLLIENGYKPQWSPNGEFIAYEFEDGLFVYNTNTKDIKQVYKIMEGEIAERMTWSPDNNWIAFRITSAKIEGIFVVPANKINSSPKQLIDYGVSNLDWSPNGDKIIFTTVTTPYSNKMYLMEVPKEYRPK